MSLRKYGLILLLAAVVIVSGCSQPSGQATGQGQAQPTLQATGKPDCPYECCPYGDFKIKDCNADYNCINNKCIPVDTDRDSLTDIEERRLGTNPNLYDSDGDTLSDYQETRVVGTNPLKLNTDDDRYNDNVDKQPLDVNTARVSVEIISKDWNWQILGFLQGIQNLDTNFIAAKPSATIKVYNSGNDYTEYVKYDVVLKVLGKDIKTIEQSFGRLDAQEEQTKTYDYQVKIGDAAGFMGDALAQRSTDWVIEIRNIRYEKFP